MAYTAYTTNQVFENNGINTAINSLYTAIDNHKDFTASSLVLSGTAAAIAQGSESMTPVRVIPFITSNTALFNFIVQSIKQLWPSAQIITFKDRIQVVMYDHFFEFWYLDIAINTVTVSGVVVQDTDQIPNYLK